MKWPRASRARCIAAPSSVPEHADGDLLVQGAVELVAAAHVAGRNEVGTDHAGQLFAWVRLVDAAGEDQVIHSSGGSAASVSSSPALP